MTRTFTQVPPDSTGDKLAMRSYTEGSHELHSQGVYFDGLPTYGVINDNIGIGNDKYYIYLRNDAGSDQTVWILALYMLNNLTSSVSTAGLRFNFMRVTGTPTMTSLTPFPFNTADPALTGVTAGHTVTAGLTDGQLILPFVSPLVQQTGNVSNVQPITDVTNRLGPVHPYMRPLALRPGEAVALRQVTTAGGGGSYTVIIHFAVEPD